MIDNASRTARSSTSATAVRCLSTATSASIATSASTATAKTSTGSESITRCISFLGGWLNEERRWGIGIVQWELDVKSIGLKQMVS